jgi:hypothetical protein
MFDNPLTRWGFGIAIVIILLPFIIGFLPEIPFPAEIETAFLFIFENLYSWEFIFPINTLFVIFGLWIGMEITFIVIYIIIFIWRLITSSVK